MRSGEDPPALVWRSPALRIALAALPGWFTIAVLIFSIPVSIKLAVGAVLFTSLISPAAGLLLVAATAPLDQFLTAFVGLDHFRVSEALVLAFFTGWLLSAPTDRRGPSVTPTIGWLLAACIVGSMIGLAWQVAPYRDVLLRTGGVVLFAYYHTDFLGDRVGLVDGARLLEGLGLMAAAVTLFRQRPRLAERLPAALALSAVAAGCSSVLLWFGVAPAGILARYTQIGYRVSAHVADVNAAGSYFVMVLCLAVGMAFRARGWKRAPWLVAIAMTAVGLWFSESRTALAALGVTAAVAAAWIASSTWQPKWRLVAFASVVVLALAAGALRARLLERDPTYRGAGFRTEFNAASLRMMAARPLFGVGMGQYYRMSRLFLGPQLAWSYGAENAHNYFLQIGAELGLAGLALFAAWIGVGLWPAIRALGERPRDARLLGSTAGVIALLGTCLTGHPLLVDEVAFPFWIQFGLVVGLAGSILWNEAPTGSRQAAGTSLTWPKTSAALAVGILLSALMSGVRGHIEPGASQAVDGFYGWETGSHGRRFRWTERYASLFVPGDVTHANIQVRVPTQTRAVSPMGVEVMVGGADQGRTLVGESWTTISVALRETDPLTRFKRIDLKMDRTWQPALYIAGSGDLRSVGIQVGECELQR